MQSPKLTTLSIVITASFLAACSSAAVVTPAVDYRAAASIQRGAPAVSGHFKVIFAFDQSDAGAYPVGIALDKSGNIFGINTGFGNFGGGNLYELTLQGGTYKQHLLFASSCTADGCQPESSPFLDGKTGDVFIVDSWGGPGFGTVVRLAPLSGTYTLAARFAFGAGIGTQPIGNPIIVNNKLYAAACCNNGSPSGGAAMVALDPVTLEGSVVYPFPNGEISYGNLSTDGSGAIYGTTSNGGSAGAGTVFRFVPSPSGGTETDLHVFEGKSDGQYPVGGLIFDKEGDIYGTTGAGGLKGDGIIFKLIPTGSGYVESILHTFSGTPDGANPGAALAIDGKLLWGSTITGGDAQCNCGTIFSLSRFGAEYRVRHTFVGTDGSYPSTDFAKFGKTLYGTTLEGGTAQHAAGVVFRYTP
jgi:uncharacterized repeat protein (TIGR03803 family)